MEKISFEILKNVTKFISSLAKIFFIYLNKLLFRIIFLINQIIIYYELSNLYFLLINLL